ncbi:hypothetical protein H6F86_29230 [Phormidium sp. FACHB-592]|uniref:Peptidase M50 n=1 Tax=Stenomitos frigidus AS-A4 TaxID=2933935 RepID=A0ABV0KDH1_9CYAN|nr:hypothetical protein [Phormidium sp. FACHB-592]MBD2077898.1 hypothetical protein [Phormidium sp. FACHB-592]
MIQPDCLSTIKRLAKQGDRAALAQLISYAVAHKQIAATVAFDADRLHVGLEGASIPNQQIATTLIERELVSLRQAAITTVVINGTQTGASEPAWVHELQLEAPVPVVARPLRRSPYAAQRSRRQKPFTLTVNDVLTFLATFDPPKAVFVSLLALYGFFGASNYTVDGFLEGSDRIMMFLHGVNLIFHEAGHTILAIFGRFLHILGGSLMQVMVPAVIAGYFVVTRQMYASAIALCWTAQNLWDVSIYIKDAQARSLPLLGGEGVLHDWHFLLLDLHLLTQDQLMGGIAFFLGSLLYVAAIAGGFYYARMET